MVTSFYTEVIQKSPLYTSVTAIKDMDLLFPPFRAKVEAFVTTAAKEGHSLLVFETYRSSARQLSLFKQHLTELKNVGVHKFGLACDLCFLDNGVPSWKGDFTLFVKWAKEQNLISGYDWGFPDKPHSFRDMDHIQFVSVKDQNKLFSEEWYPSQDYNPYENL